jgi:nitroimidazol reductase NimA-like FMN-containing flavoprotein (pyridoxamine 5'-phosphate oxidase superfamily)
MPETRFDGSFSHPDAVATPWETTEQVLREAELYWLTTVRTDGRPHVTPLVGLWLDESAYFTTGHDEQKARNLAHSPLVALTTGSNSWASGLDVVAEGRATRVREQATLERAARAYLEKYGEDWRFDVTGDEMAEGDHPSGLYRITPAKVLTFAKDPHAQTTYTFG